MRNFLLGALMALCIVCVAETENPDGSKTYTSMELAAMWGTFQEMSEEITRLEGEVNKANSVFVQMNKKIKQLESTRCL